MVRCHHAGSASSWHVLVPSLPTQLLRRKRIYKDVLLTGLFCLFLSSFEMYAVEKMMSSYTEAEADVIHMSINHQVWQRFV